MTPRGRQDHGVPPTGSDGLRDFTPGGETTSTLWAMGLTQHANGTDLVTSL